MNRKLLIVFIAATAWLALTGESCLLENKNVEVPFRGNADMTFTSTGTSDSGFEIIDFAAELQAVEDEGGDIGELISARIENGYWRALVNRGDPGTMVSGSVTVTRTSTGTTQPLTSFTSVAVNSVLGDFVLAPLDAAGTNLLVQGFDEYITARNAGAALPNLSYRFDWSTTGSPAPVDFDWEARIKFVLVGVFSVEVPDVWGN